MSSALYLENTLSLNGLQISNLAWECLAMYKRLIAPVLTLLLGGISGNVLADGVPGNYWGLEYSKLDYLSSVGRTTGGAGTELNAPMISGKYGREIGSWFSVEGRLGLGQEGLDNAFGDKFDIWMGSVFFRFNFPLDRTNLYLLAGGSVVNVDTGCVGQPAAPSVIFCNEDRDFHAAAGLGIDLKSTKEQMLYFELIKTEQSDLDPDSPQMNILTIGYKRHFRLPRFR